MKTAHREAPPRYVIAEIRHLLAKSGCPLCHAEAEALERFLFWFFHESYGEPEVVLQYVQARGFCAEHLKLVAERGPQWQVSAMFSWIIEDLLTALRTSLAAVAEKRPLRFRSWRKGATRVLEPTAGCLFCDVIERTQESLIPMLLEALEYDETLRARFVEVGGCCVPHALLVARSARGEQQRGLLLVLEVLQKQLESTKHDLDEFFRKADYRYAHEPRGAEQHAWRRALVQFGYKSDRESPTQRQTSQEQGAHCPPRKRG